MQKYDPLCRGNVDRDYTGRDTLLTGERIVLVDITALVYAMSVVLDRLNCAYNCVFAGLKAPCDESRIMAQAGSSTGS